MKELSIEEKAKAYDEALKQIKECTPDENGFITIYPNEIFPELKENEDEKIINLLKRVVEKWHNVGYSDYVMDTPKSDIIAWLEKQGEHAKFCDSIQVGDKVTRNQDGMLINLSQLKRVAKPAEKYNITGIGSKNAQGKLGEMIKNLKSADKVEPKFKVGDTVKDPYGDLYHITEIIDDSYKTDEGRFILFENQEVYTLSNFTAWSEEDRTNLFECIKAIKGNYSTVYGQELTNWLKSLENRVLLQTSEWSEEDEKILKAIHSSVDVKCLSKNELDYVVVVNWLKSLKNRVQLQNIAYYNPYKEVVESIAKMCKHYDNMDVGSLQDFYDNVKVKCKDAKEYDSLFPQSTWKPSEEQMKALESIFAKHGAYDDDLLSLISDLKKLREE